MIEYFTIDEFDCKCGCGFNNIKKHFLLRLDNARKIAELPFIINSGCRCIDHNKNINGVVNSSHLYGIAADIKTKNNIERYKIVQSLIDVGFFRIGIANNFIHVDEDLSKSKYTMWVY
jgi:uncharacterized protein YcbK (DUF882 family)